MKELEKTIIEAKKEDIDLKFFIPKYIKTVGDMLDYFRRKTEFNIPTFAECTFDDYTIKFVIISTNKYKTKDVNIISERNNLLKNMPFTIINFTKINLSNIEGNLFGLAILIKDGMCQIIDTLPKLSDLKMLKYYFMNIAKLKYITMLKIDNWENEVSWPVMKMLLYIRFTLEDNEALEDDNFANIIKFSQAVHHFNNGGNYLDWRQEQRDVSYTFVLSALSELEYTRFKLPKVCFDISISNNILYDRKDYIINVHLEFFLKSEDKDDIYPEQLYTKKLRINPASFNRSIERFFDAFKQCYHEAVKQLG